MPAATRFGPQTAWHDTRRLTIPPGCAPDGPCALAGPATLKMTARAGARRLTSPPVTGVPVCAGTASHLHTARLRSRRYTTPPVTGVPNCGGAVTEW